MKQHQDKKNLASSRCHPLWKEVKLSDTSSLEPKARRKETLDAILEIPPRMRLNLTTSREMANSDQKTLRRFHFESLPRFLK